MEVFRLGTRMQSIIHKKLQVALLRICSYRVQATTFQPVRTCCGLNSSESTLFECSTLRRCFSTGHNFGHVAEIAELRDQCRTQISAVGKMSEEVEKLEEKSEKYFFGPWKIDAREVFLTTEHCYCFVNLRPVVPEEVADLWLTAQKVGKKLELFFKATSLTLAIQDGPEAGQTVPHIHVHILPRQKRDFENNDEIYDELDKKEKELNEAKKEEEKHLNLDEERKDRSRKEMFEEASKLRTLFQ